jgi:hypothetical protein
VDLIFQQDSTINSVRVEEYRWQSAESEGVLRRLSPVTPTQIMQLLGQKRFQIESLYNEQKSPYPGALSQVVRCPKELLPLIQSDSSMQMDVLRIQAGANSRKILGVCDPSELAFRAVVLEIFCKEAKVLFEVEGFLKKSSTEKTEKWETWLKQVSCKIK